MARMGQNHPPSGRYWQERRFFNLSMTWKVLTCSCAQNAKSVILSPSHQQTTWWIYVKPVTNNKIKIITSTTISILFGTWLIMTTIMYGMKMVKKQCSTTSLKNLCACQCMRNCSLDVAQTLFHQCT